MRRFILLMGLLAVPASAGLPQQRTATRSKAVPARVIAKPHVIPATGVLGAPDLVAIAKLKAAGAADQFSDEPTLAFVGRDFRVDIPASDLTIAYDREARRLTASTSKYSDYVLFGRDTRESQYSGQNGFGAKAKVAKVNGDDFGMWLPGDNIYSRKPITFSSEMDGESARALSAALKLRVYGKVVKATGTYAEKNSAIYKKSLVMQATVSSPLDMDVTSWLVAVSISKAEWIDSRTGSVVSAADVAPQ